MGLGNAAGFPEGVALDGAWRMEGVQQGLDKVSDEENRVTRARRGRAEDTSSAWAPRRGRAGRRVWPDVKASWSTKGGAVLCSAGSREPPKVLGAEPCRAS